MRFHPLPLECPDCGKKMTVMELLGRADATLKIKLLCIPCGDSHIMQVPMLGMAVTLARLDEPRIVQPKHRQIGFLAKRRKSRKPKK